METRVQRRTPQVSRASKVPNGTASTVKFEEAKKFLLQNLREDSPPEDQELIFDRAWADERIPDTELRLALWELLRQGVLELTPDWRVRQATADPK